VPPVPGLYTLGLPWQHIRGSALLGWVGADAAFVADQIARHPVKVDRSDAVGLGRPGTVG